MRHEFVNVAMAMEEKEQSWPKGEDSPVLCCASLGYWHVTGNHL